MNIDTPIFDYEAWNLSVLQRELCDETRKLALNKFSSRASKYDINATFPTENYKDLHKAGLMGICIPKEYGGRGADLKTYMLAAAEIGRFCGSTALTFNMHVSSCLWTGFLTDNLEMDEKVRCNHNEMRERHYNRILKTGSIYAQPFSEGNSSAAGHKAFATTALLVDGGWIVNGKKFLLPYLVMLIIMEFCVQS